MKKEKQNLTIDSVSESKNYKPSVTFYLNDYEGRKKEKPIMCYVHCNRKYDKHKPIKFSTGLNINPDYWSKKKNPVTGKPEQTATGVFEFLNRELELLKIIIENLYDEYLKERKSVPKHSVADFIFKDGTIQHMLDAGLNRKIILQEFNNARAELKKHSGQIELVLVKDKITPSIEKQNLQFVKNISTGQYDFKSERPDPSSITFADYVKLITDKIELQKGKDQVKMFKTFLVHLNEFHSVNNLTHPKLSEVSTEYFEAFSLWTQTTKDWRLKYWSKQNDHCKKFFNYAKNKHRLENLPEVNWKIDLLKKRSEKTKSVALNSEQLQKIINLKFTKEQETLECCRDLFIIGSFCGGLRVSDLKRLENVLTTTVNGKEIKYLEAWSEKIKAYVKLPLFKPVIKILEKYDNKVPEMISEQNFRWNIKTIGELAGLTQIVTDKHIIVKNNKWSDPIEKRFCDMMSSKTARKTFCTMMLREYKIDPITIMAFSTHKKLASFEEYIEDNSDDKIFNDFALMALKDKKFK